MSNVPGLFVLGEANFSDHGANRLGASALMQGLADGYFVIPHTLGNWLARVHPDYVDPGDAHFTKTFNDTQAMIDRLRALAEGNRHKSRTLIDIYRDLGTVMYDKVGVAREGTKLKEAISDIAALRADFWENVTFPTRDGFNKYFEVAGRLADFLEIGEVMARDALNRDESAGCHLRLEHESPEGEAVRDDENFTYVAAWEWTGENQPPILHKEKLEFKSVHLVQRNYKD